MDEQRKQALADLMTVLFRPVVLQRDDHGTVHEHATQLMVLSRETADMVDDDAITLLNKMLHTGFVRLNVCGDEWVLRLSTSGEKLFARDLQRIMADRAQRN